MKPAAVVSSRTPLYRSAWVLFVVAILISRGSPLGDAASLARQMRVGVSAFRFAGITLLVLCWFSNIVFMTTVMIYKAAQTSIGWRALLLGSLAVNIAILLFFPGYAAELNYWFWLLAFAAAAWALLFMPADRVRSASEIRQRKFHQRLDDDVPVLIWLWLACTVFWIGVMAAEWRHPAGLAAPASASRKPIAQLRSYVDDPSGSLAAGEAANISTALADFEKETSNQLAVVIYPQAPAEAIDDFTIRAAEAWKVGRQGRDNGAILFLFLKERVARLEVGYGLEGALPDAIARRILAEHLAASAAHGDIATAVDGAVRAVIERVRTEYSGGRQPGIVRTTIARLGSVATTGLPLAWPFLRDLTVGNRVGISFFISLIGLGVASGFANTGRIVWNIAHAVMNLIRRRPFRQGMLAVELGSVFDTLKIAAVLLIPLAGVVVLIAGGGAFGGAGATIRW